MADYNLDALGWFQFERLCQALLKSAYSMAIEAWGGSGDNGRDAYFDGVLDFPNRRNPTSGRFVFQAKFVAGANATGAKFMNSLNKAVDAELSRIADRIAEDKWDDPTHYTLLTNAPVTSASRTALRKRIRAALTECDVQIMGASDLDAMLDLSDSIRLSYPQLLGLRDLKQLISNSVHADVLARSQLAYELARELAAVYVPTAAHTRALNQLDARGFVVLTGPPEMGKTTTARMIALGRLSGGWEAHECINPSDFFRLYDPSLAQVFVADDAFGSTEYKPDLAYEWARDLERIIAAVDHRHWVIWTSRPAPLEQALRELHFQGKARHFPDPGRVQVNAAVLDVRVKAQMLYRHAKAGELSDDERKAIRDMAKSIVMSPQFTPLRIARLVRDDLPGIMVLPPGDRESAFRKAVATGLRTPTAALKTSFNALPDEHKRLLISMLDASSRNATRRELIECYQHHAPEGSPMTANEVLDMLDDHFLSIQVGMAP